MKKKIISITIDVIIWIFLLGFAAIVLIPLAFMFTASFMPSNEIMKMPYPWIPSEFRWQNYWQAIKGNDGNFLFLRSIWNSFLVASITTIGTVFLCSLTGFGLAKYKFKGRNFVFFMILGTLMIPFEAIMIPLYLIVTEMGMQDTYAGMIIPLLMSPFGVFMMRQYLLTFPDEMLDAARIDGASEFGIYWRIVLPNSVPAIATLSILTFRSQWDNLLWPLLIVQSPEKKTIPLFITIFVTEKYTNEGAMMAAAAIASIPMIILFLTLTKYFLAGSEVFAARKD
ncbi:MAG TPA: carbohydrate ABC transporter permease [Fervidobacterium sp.]|nr:carbohydrate ABC transporter permease [Fervidobacterium sp.]HOV54081.1 carbohydrate ABC transporter permease [Fervidobacterium sp.]HPC24631.1 carbohydrate ABC transporter permease [Fervidobacterium sp.]HPT58585.1 carbohydrate ABC transporter permease [Fervidobacterium sp.]HQO05323.1 carbohydrate ABC transporter permease [Fervidobacterium sp.]